MDCCAFKHKIEGKVQTFPLKVYPLKTAYNQAFGASIFRCLRVNRIENYLYAPNDLVYNNCQDSA